MNEKNKIIVSFWKGDNKNPPKLTHPKLRKDVLSLLSIEFDLTEVSVRSNWLTKGLVPNNPNPEENYNDRIRDRVIDIFQNAIRQQETLQNEKSTI